MDIIPNYNLLYVKLIEDDTVQSDTTKDGFVIPENAIEKKQYIKATILEVGLMDKEKYEYYKGETIVIPANVFGYGREIDHDSKTFLIPVEKVDGSIVTI